MRQQDLNLLMVFDAIMTEGSITRAANRLAMTQPAVSNALSRMRVAWKDELFVKDGRGVQPTAYARNLWTQINAPLRELEEAVDPTQFDPTTAKRTFRVVVSDIMVNIVWAPLRAHLEAHAPNINIYAIPNTIINNEAVLHDAEVDLVCGAPILMDSVIRSEFLFHPKYVCIMRPNHPIAKPTLQMADFLNADHLLVSMSGDTTGLTDLALLQMGLSRRVAMTVNHFSAVAPLVKSSDLICVVPSMAVDRDIFSGELAIYETPFDMQPNQIGMLWHKRQDKDQGLIWLRNLIGKIVRDSANAHFEKLSKCCRKGNCPSKQGQSPAYLTGVK